MTRQIKLLLAAVLATAATTTTWAFIPQRTSRVLTIPTWKGAPSTPMTLVVLQQERESEQRERSVGSGEGEGSSGRGSSYGRGEGRGRGAYQGRGGRGDGRGRGTTSICVHVGTQNKLHHLLRTHHRYFHRFPFIHSLTTQHFLILIYLSLSFSL